jgi:hypothetical protein
MKSAGLLAVGAALFCAGCSTTGANLPSEATLGSIAREGGYYTGRYNTDLTEYYRRYGDPQRPVDCPRYVVDPDDECY